MGKGCIEHCFRCWCDPYRTAWENPLRMTDWRRVWSLLSVENCAGCNPRTLSNACGNSGSPTDFTLAGFRKRGFSTNNICFHLNKINWFSNRLALFHVIRQSWFVAIYLETARRVRFGNTSYANKTEVMCTKISFWKCPSTISTGNLCEYR
jgi:hypothetical protein